jgi:uncharacterized membrane protein
MKRFIVAVATAALLASSAAPALADPITCPPGQHSEKVNGVWKCVNNGGNTSNAAETKNPND